MGNLLLYLELNWKLNSCAFEISWNLACFEEDKCHLNENLLYFLRLAVVEMKNVHCSILGEIGDVVVGRVTEVQQKRWKVDINCRLDAGQYISLATVNPSQFSQLG